MTELDNAIEMHMKYLVFEEKRPFSFADFRRFEVDGKEYRVAHGTFRNKILLLRKAGKVELDCNSGTAFYTLKGQRFSQPMTHHHTVGILSPSRTTGVGRQTPLYKWLKNLPVEKQSLHNIRLRFQAKGIWKVFSYHYSRLVDPSNKDIKLESRKFNDNIDVTVTIRHTDTVTVVVACSYRPIATDVTGLLQITETLVRTEVELKNLIEKESKTIMDRGMVRIPSYREWTGTMWHFGVDGIDAYSSPAFHITFEEGMSDIYTIYIKRMKTGQLKPRLERQEYSSDNPFVNIFLQKLYPGGYLTE